MRIQRLLTNLLFHLFTQHTENVYGQPQIPERWINNQLYGECLLRASPQRHGKCRRGIRAPKQIILESEKEERSACRKNVSIGMGSAKNWDLLHTCLKKAPNTQHITAKLHWASTGLDCSLSSDPSEILAAAQTEIDSAFVPYLAGF